MRTKIDLSVKKVTIDLKNASGSYNLSIRLPAKITSNLPRSALNLHASPWKYLTLVAMSLYFCYNTCLAA